MKKIALTVAFAATLIMGGFNVSAANNCPNDSTCNTPLVVKAYDNAKCGAVNLYDKAKDGTVNTYNKVANGTEKVYNKVAVGTVSTYNKAKNGIEKGANAVKQEWNKIF